MTTAFKSAPALEVEVAGDDASLATAETTRTLNRSKRSLADYERAVEHYPDAIRSRVRWLQGYFLEECKGSSAALRAIICKSSHDRKEGWIYNLLAGYNFRNKEGTWSEGGRSWSEFLEIYDAVRRYADQAARQGRQQFVETPTYRCIADFITARRALNAVCKVGGITGPTGGQKSAALAHYALLNNHGTVIRIEAPACPRIAVLQRKIADRYKIKGAALSYISTRESAIRENVNETRTIIIDNAQRLYVPGKGNDQPCFNYLLELQEDTNCTLILSFTTDFTDTISAGRAKGYFEQFVGRMGGMRDILRLPDYTPASDLAVIARSFGLQAGKTAIDYLHRWSREDGRIRIVFSRLQRAQDFAKLDGRDRITLADLAEANDYTPPAIGTDTEGEA